MNFKKKPARKRPATWCTSCHAKLSNGKHVCFKCREVRRQIRESLLASFNCKARHELHDERMKVLRARARYGKPLFPHTLHLKEKEVQ